MASVTYGKCYLWQRYYGKCNYGKDIMANETEPISHKVYKGTVVNRTYIRDGMERDGTNGSIKKEERERNDLAEGPRSRTELNDFKKVGTCPALISVCIVQHLRFSGFILYPL